MGSILRTFGNNPILIQLTSHCYAYDVPFHRVEENEALKFSQDFNPNTPPAPPSAEPALSAFG